jgi:hypothetical protein
MAHQRLQKGAWQMLLVAGNDGRFVLHQFGKPSVGDGYLRILKHHIAQILDWEGGRRLSFFRKVYNQLFVLGTQVSGITEEEGAFDHFSKIEINGII